MKISLLFLLAFATVSCAGLKDKVRPRPESGSATYVLKDKTGEYLAVKNVKLQGAKVATKKEIYGAAGEEKPLEKTVALSERGVVRTKKGKRPALRPLAAQHTVWFDKKKFSSSMKVDLKNKRLEVSMDSPEEKWKGKKTFDFPKGTAFCFFSQLAECVRVHGYLSQRKGPKEVQLIWDSYPYHAEIFQGVGNSPFAKGVWAYDKRIDGNERFGLLIDGQLILFDFDDKENLRNIFWVAQGFSMTGKQE